MKKLKKLLLVLFTLFLLPHFALADTFNDINKPVDINQDNVVITNIKFNDLSNTTSQNFGFTGDIVNNNDYNVKVDEVVNYYDSSNKLIHTETVNQLIKAKDTIKYTEMSNASGVNNISSIKYYTLNIVVTNYTYTVDQSTLPSKNLEYTSYPYVIDGYNVNIVVNEDNSFDITETIDTYFNTSKHGIIRTIPLTNNVIHSDVNTTNHAKVSNIVINEVYSSSKDSDNNLAIKIGREGRTVKGAKQYIISYKYTLSKDNISAYDEFYYNIIGTNWDTYIGNITFKITMPKDFDVAKLGFASGTSGSTTNSVTYNVKGNVITGEYHGNLQPNQALTIRLVLDNNYFDLTPIDTSTFISYIIPLGCLLLSYIIWHFAGKDRKTVEVIGFNPPKNINSLKTAYIYNEQRISSANVSSLLIYLASKGYIEIIEDKDDENKFTLKRLKDYNGKDEYERRFFDGLFSINNTDSLFGFPITKSESTPSKVVTSEELKYKFYRVIDKIKNDIFFSGMDNIFEKDTILKRLLILGLLAITIITAFVMPITQNYDEYNSSIILFPLISTLLFIGVMVFFAYKNSNNMVKGYSLAMLIVIIPICIGNSTTYFKSMLTFFSDFPLQAMVGLGSIVAEYILMLLMPKKTAAGSKLYGEILGFRRFLETADKDQLEAQVKKNPTYFYDILPYTYVLGVSDIWVKKFESITLEPPDWYYHEGSDDFNLNHFNDFVTSSVYNSPTLTAARSSSGSSGYDGGGGGFSGGSSGGGFSGGGSGGGGGSSW